MEDQHQQAARIDQLLEDLRSLAPAPVWQRIEELVQRLVQLYGTGLARWSVHVREAGVLDESLASRVAGDELLASLLLLHDLHPWPVERRIARALADAGPQLRAHLGELTLLDVDAGVVRIRADGAASMTADAAERLIQRALGDAAPEIVRVEVEGAIRPEPREALVQIGLPGTRAGAAR